jgi:hypothetical protein
MPLFTRQELRARAAQNLTYTRAAAVLSESAKSFSPYKTYDVFLSHSYLDAQEILGLKLTLEDQGLSIYVDWIEDPQVDRSKVTKTTAELLRVRMKSCRSLFYATSPSAENSKWMPWELGYFDGLKTRVAVVPIVEGQESTFAGREYLSLYPWIDKYGASMFVNGLSGANSYQAMRAWITAA